MSAICTFILSITNKPLSFLNSCSLLIISLAIPSFSKSSLISTSKATVIFPSFATLNPVISFDNISTSVICISIFSPSISKINNPFCSNSAILFWSNKVIAAATSFILAPTFLPNVLKFALIDLSIAAMYSNSFTFTSAKIKSLTCVISSFIF